MANPKWGTKRICQNCGTKFYDLKKTPIICPSCETQFDPEALLKSRRPRAAAKPDPKPKAAAKPAPAEDEAADDEEEAIDVEDEEADALLKEAAGDDDDDNVIEDTSDLGDDDDMADVVVEGEKDDT